MFRKLLITMMLVLTFTMLTVRSVSAIGSDSQPVEWAIGSNYRASLTSLGMGWLVIGDKCDSNDYVMRINKNYSADPDRFRIYSYDSKVQGAFSGKSPIGHNLSGTSAYLCLGYRDTWNGGGPLNVASKLFVWVK